MAKTELRDRLGCQDQLFEETFLLLVQTQIQRLVNDKQLRYRDLSKRLGVSEARVSQMLGDEGVNLTIRTIARIFRQLGETPLLMSQRAFDEAISERALAAHVPIPGWTMLTVDAQPFEVASVELVEDDEEYPEGRLAENSEWIEARSFLSERAG